MFGFGEKKKKAQNLGVGIFAADEDLGDSNKNDSVHNESLKNKFEEAPKRAVLDELSKKDVSLDSFKALSALLKDLYKSEDELKDVTKPVSLPLAFVQDSTGFTVNVQRHAHAYRIEEKSVRVEIPEGSSLSTEAADFMASTSKTTKLNGKPVVLNGSSEEKILLLFAAEKNGLDVKNAAEIKKLQKTEPALWAAVETRWETHVAKTVFDKPVGDISVDLAIAPDQERKRAGEVQADLVAISLKRPKDDKTDLFKLMRDPAEREAKKQSLGVTEDDMKAARNIASVKEGKGVPNDVPKFFMILNIPQGDKNLIMQAQADVRALKSTEYAKTGRAVAMSEQESDRMFGKIGAFGNEPASVVNAQTRWQNASAHEGRVARGVEQKPGLPGLENAALESLKTVAEAFYQKGHKMAGQALEIIAESYKPAAPAAAPSAPKPSGAAPA